MIRIDRRTDPQTDIARFPGDPVKLLPVLLVAQVEQGHFLAKVGKPLLDGQGDMAGGTVGRTINNPVFHVFLLYEF
jgi:hypothetical protein